MRGLWIFLLVCAAIAAFQASSLRRDRRNTLERYPEWKSAKTQLALGVNGARSFTVTPITLLGGALNLGAWHGQQEVTLDEQWQEFPRVKLRVFASGQAEWSLLARSLQGQKDFGLRLSSAAGVHGSAWLWLSADRLFEKKVELDYRLPADRWVQLSLYGEEGKLVVDADGARIASLEAPHGSWRLSLRGNSSEGVLRVDDLELVANRAQYTQDFSGGYPLPVFALLWSVLFGFFLLLQLMAGSSPALGAAFACALGSLLLPWAYEHRIGNRYPDTVDLGGFSANIEWRAGALERMQNMPPGRPILLWLGGSQAWGAGASVPAKSAFERLKTIFEASPLEFVNGAISAATLEDQLEVLRIAETRRVVKAVVLTTGVNDANNPEFAAKLALFYNAVKARGAKLLLVPEPVDPPVALSVQTRHNEVRAFAAEHGIPLVDLPAVFSAKADAGFLWWDFVHLSDSGAAIAAEAMAPALRKFLAGNADIPAAGLKKKGSQP